MSARQVANESSEEEYFSVRAHDYAVYNSDTSDTDAEDIQDTAADMSPPRHPVPSMQGAFEESIYESSEPNPRPKSAHSTAEARRQRVLEVNHYDDAWITRWKQKPSACHHPLAKLMAQIVFGMHLLHQQAAKSDEEVVKILQTHVDEVDNFLEKTTDDFDLAIKDIAERIRFLKLPMSHPDVFGKMLEDKQFRTQLMEGNDKIENIIERTTRAMNAAVLDMQKGKAATKELGFYLNSVSDDWPGEKRDLEAVLTAMRGNEQGWKHCYKDLQTKSAELRDDLDELSTVIKEMARMASEASRRARANARAGSAAQSPMSTAIPRSKFNSDNRASRSRPLSVDKPLPRAPLPQDGPVELEAHPIPMERRYEQPRATPASPKQSDQARTQRSSTIPPRPSTSNSNMEPREAQNRGRNSTQDIVEFLQEARQPSPLRSNPPDNVATRPRAADNPNRRSAIDVAEHAKALSALDGSRPGTADGTSAPPYMRRNSDTQHTQKNSHRVGIERNKDGPPVSGRRESSIGPRFMRRLSFRSRKGSPSPPPNRGNVRTAEPITPTPASRQASFSNNTNSRPTFSHTNSRNSLSTANNNSNAKLAPASEVLIQRATTPHLRPPSTQPQPASEAPSTPSAASARSTTNSPSFTTTVATTPGTDTASHLSPTVNKSQASTGPVVADKRPQLADRRVSSNNALNKANGYGSGGRGSTPSPAPAPVEEEKKRSRGMSLRRFFGVGGGSSSKNATPKERPPRAAMTYGDLA